MLLKYRKVMKKLKESNRLGLHGLKSHDQDIIRKVMKSLGAYRINSFDSQIILKDLIGMAEELELRNSSLKEEIGEDLAGYVKELEENSRGSYFPELLADLIKNVSFILFIVTAVFSALSPAGNREGPLFLIILYTFALTLGELYRGKFVTAYYAEKGVRRRIPDMIFLGLLTPIVFLVSRYEHVAEQLSENVGEVDYLILAVLFGGLYLSSIIGHLWALKQLIDGREHLA